MFQYDSTHSKFMAQLRLRTEKLPPIGSLSSSSRREIPSSSGDEHVEESTAVFATMENAGTHLKEETKKSLSLPILLMPPCLWYNNSLKIVSHASWSTNCSATLAKSFMETLELPKASQLSPTLVPPSRRLEVYSSWNLWCDGHEAALSISPVSTSSA